MPSMFRRAVLALLVAVAAPAVAQTSSVAAEESRAAAQQVFRGAGLEVTLPPGLELPVGGRSERDTLYQSFWSRNGTDETRVVGRGRMHVVQSGPHRVITILHSAEPGEPVDEQAVVAMFDSLRLADPVPAATNRR